MMKIGFKNFRRFKDFPMIELGGCTFLVGTNNSGKSTLIKALLLIGNNTKYNDYSPLFQPFMCNFNFGNIKTEHLYLGDFWSNKNSESPKKQIDFSFVNSDTYFSFIIDGESLDDDLPAVQINVRENIIYNETFDVTFRWVFENEQEGTIDFSYNPQRTAEWFAIHMEQILNSDIHDSSLFNKTFDDITDKSFRKHLEAIDGYLESSALESRNNTVARIEKAIKYYKSIEGQQIIKEPFKLLNEVDIACNIENWPDMLYDFFCVAKEIMNEDFLSCKQQMYIEAHNATHRNLLNVEDKNDYLAQTVFKYISLIGEKKRKEYAHKFVLKWLQELNIGNDFTISSVYNEAYTIEILGKNGRLAPLSDFGTGSIQLLILLLHIEMALVKSTGLILVEEPEQNLHPALQSKLADMFYEVWKESEGRINFVVETHSEYIVRHTQVIAAKEIDNGTYTTEEWNDAMKVYYFPEEGLPYLMGYRQNGHFERQFGKGFYDEAGNSTRELYRIDRGINK